MSGSTALDADRRRRELAEIGEGKPVDVLVIGGGITGVGVALDAASRGLRTVLVERHDLAFGTSRWSSKLVHGGLRYLASGNVGIARECAVERHILMTRTAPHLVRAMPQLVPLLPSLGRAERTLVRAGFLAGDALRATAGTPATLLPRSRRVGADEAVRLAPAVRRDGLAGGMLAYDGQLVDDARLVVAVARTAAGHGAKILTRVSAHDVVGDRARLHDELTGEEMRVSARAVVNAAGVWAGQVDPEITLRPSRGTHLVLSAARLGNPTAALTVPIPGANNRFVFALPAQLGRVYLGLTDEAAPGEIPDVPAATEDEVEFLLDVLNTALSSEVTRADVLGTYSGLRPLLHTGDGATSDLSRRHAVLRSSTGVISVVGGKLTTYRRMARDAVDVAVRASGLACGPCTTGNLPVVGAGTVPPGLPPSLLARYGAEAPAVAAGDRTPVADGLDVTRAELAFALAQEGALNVDDLLDRRTRIGLVPADRERAIAAARDIVAARHPNC